MSFGKQIARFYLGFLSYYNFLILHDHSKTDSSPLKEQKKEIMDGQSHKRKLLHPLQAILLSSQWEVFLMCLKLH